MKRVFFALWRTFVFAAAVPALAFSLVACDPENGIGGVGDDGDTIGDTTSVNNGTTDKFEPVAVDLGLSVRWANCNVGATSPEEYGDYFAWGETAPKSSYFESYSLTRGLLVSTLKSRGIVGPDGNLTAAYDAATVNWERDWRMPTLDEINELLEKCTLSWTTQNGVKGLKVTASNGNSIFLPAAGFRQTEWPYIIPLFGAGSTGLYWSATPYSFIYNAYNLDIDSVSNDWSWFSRDCGLTVRPVTER